MIRGEFRRGPRCFVKKNNDVEGCDFSEMELG